MDQRTFRRVVPQGQQQSYDALVEAIREVDLGQSTCPSSEWLDWIAHNVPDRMQLVVVTAAVDNNDVAPPHQVWHVLQGMAAVTALSSEELARLRRDSIGLVLVDIQISDARSLVDAFGGAALGVIHIARPNASASATADVSEPRVIEVRADADAKLSALLTRLLPADMLEDCRRAWILEQLTPLSLSVGRILKDRLVHTSFNDWLHESSRHRSSGVASLREQQEDLAELRESLEKELSSTTSANGESNVLMEFRTTCEPELRRLIDDRFSELLNDVATNDPPKDVIATTSTDFWGQLFGRALSGLVGRSRSYRLRGGRLLDLAQKLAQRADAFLNERVSLREERAIARILASYREPLASLSVNIPEEAGEVPKERAPQSSGTRVFSGLEGNLIATLRKEEDRDLLHYEKSGVLRSFMQARGLATPLLFLAGLGLTFMDESAAKYRPLFLGVSVVIALVYLVAMALTEKSRVRMELAEKISALRDRLLEQLPTTIAAACQQIPADRKAALDRQIRLVKEMIEARVRTLSQALSGVSSSVVTQIRVKPVATASPVEKAAVALENASMTLLESLTGKVRNRR